MNSISGPANSTGEAYSRKIELFEPYVPENEVRRVVRAVLRWAAIQDGHHSEKRVNDRFTYLSNLVIGLPESDPCGTESLSAMRACYGWTRNLSSSGVSVILAAGLATIGYADHGDQSAVLKTLRVLPPESACSVLFFNRNLEATCLLTRVARARELQGNLVEVGLQFLAKLDSNNHPIANLLMTAAEQFSTRLGWLQSPPDELIREYVDR